MGNMYDFYGLHEELFWYDGYKMVCSADFVSENIDQHKTDNCSYPDRFLGLTEAVRALSTTYYKFYLEVFLTNNSLPL